MTLSPGRSVLAKAVSCSPPLIRIPPCELSSVLSWKRSTQLPDQATASTSTPPPCSRTALHGCVFADERPASDASDSGVRNGVVTGPNSSPQPLLKESTT
ncbi:hypothetical protein GCM10023317_15200 [Actinopolymorpha pittospori]|uniref:Uncharacterized protein n=1 Tax=Actinopolymorpha pittospori TaxID=648752 RepID=A0A927MWL0_9ACTN|nr:hypothetical protein [Actinopolymorpha pittospori]